MLVVAAALVMGLLPAVGQCAQVTLAWDANSESNLAGYTLYYGTASGNYSQHVNVGNTTSHTLSGLTEGLTYYFAATAYDDQDNESGFSQEISYHVPLTDSDGDGVPDDQEVDGTVDLDGDGTMDLDQDDIKCVTDRKGHIKIGISSRGAENIVSIAAMDLVESDDEDEIIVDPLAFGLDSGGGSSGSSDSALEDFVQDLNLDNMGCFISTAGARVDGHHSLNLWREIRGRELSIVFVLILMGCAVKEDIFRIKEYRNGRIRL